MTHQRGFALQWAMIVVFTGAFVAVPVVMFVASALRGTRVAEDSTRNYYAADAQIHAIIEDLVRGADAAPVAPTVYTPPQVSFGDVIPSVDVRVVESQTLATLKPINYLVQGNPTVIQGASPQGTGLDLNADDDSYYRLSDSGAPPAAIYEVTSQAIAFPTVSFGDIRIVAASTKGTTKVEVFIFNPTDSAHTQSGYNPIPDLTAILEVANTEQTFSVGLEAADIAYLNNSTTTKQVKIKIKATRSGGFRLDTDMILFVMAGVVTTDQRDIETGPTLLTGTYSSGNAASLRFDDTAYYAVNSAATSSTNMVRFEATSGVFAFTVVDTLVAPFIARSNSSNVTLDIFVYNPTDPAHTDGGYHPTTPDATTLIPLQNVDKTVTLAVNATDVAYINSLPTRTIRLMIRATASSPFRLDSDRLVFIATSNTAPGEVIRQITQQYFDPGMVNPNFAQMAGKEGYLLRIYNVRPGLMQINWSNRALDFSNVKSSVLIFRGVVIDGGAVVPPGKITSKPPSQGNDLLIAASSRPNEAFVQTSFIDVEAGLHTIVFFNESNSTLVSNPHFATGSKEDTWIYVPAFKDYLIETSVGNVGLKAVVRQAPGPTEPPVVPWSRTSISWMQNLVSVQSWEPYGLPESERDPDDDGIRSGVDGTFSGSFTDQSKNFSNSFTDQHRSGTSYGTIVNRSDLIVRVADHPDPTLGLSVSALGAGVGTATINACGSNIFLTSGGVATVTCSSVSVHAVRGTVAIQVNEDVRVTLPPASKTKVVEVAPGEVVLQSSPENTAPLTISLATCSGTVVTVPASSAAQVKKLAGGDCSVTNTVTSETAITVQTGAVVQTIGAGAVAAVPEGEPLPLPTPTATPPPTATPIPSPTPTPFAPPTPSPTPVPQLLTLFPVADAEIDQDDQDDNSGNQKTMMVRSDGDENARAIVRFDLGTVPGNAIVESAVLRLRSDQAPASVRSYGASRVLSAWNEKNPGGVTWATRPPTATSASAVATIVDIDETWSEWNVTLDVQKMVSGAVPNHGWEIRDLVEGSETEYSTRFYTREENGEDRDPQLILMYTASGPAPVPTATPATTPVVTATASATPTPAPTQAPSATPTPGAAPTPTPSATSTATPTSTPVPIPTPPPTTTAVPSPTATPPATNAWVALASVPSGVENGGAVAVLGDLIYVLRGDRTRNFWKFDTLTGAWTSLQNTPEDVGAGGALAAYNGNVYALRGDKKDDFWRYDPSTNGWTALADTPANVGDGGSLAVLDGKIYGIRGDDRVDFWQYDPAMNVWFTRDDLPAKVKQGTSLVAHGSCLYALRGRNTKEFWRFDATTNSWFLLSDAPNTVREGGSLASDGSRLFALRGRNSTDYWRYVVSSGGWELAASAPAKVKAGGALGFANSALHALRGGSNTEFWKYVVSQ